MRNSDPPRLGRMLELDVAAFVSNLLPAVGFQRRENVSNTHYCVSRNKKCAKIHTAIAGIFWPSGVRVWVPHRRRTALDALPALRDSRSRLYAGLGGYFSRSCIGNPPYASQQLSAQGRAHYQACKLRLLLQGEAQLSRPFPERPRNMHRRTYDRLRREGMRLEAGLSKQMRRRFPDYASLVAYTD
jgi:hypothetical protein